ncbi:ectoine/hydroxyectoine ABC transporter substrate-binding protein EhuB [Bacillus gobiensis]|uniref:ectoine/hydroxyectoine ABC transporter substrate-binding protein EhuB n=1 Tax=Bacillus gobiensis TaxID=1441095 RepID=UPI003D22C7A8
MKKWLSGLIIGILCIGLFGCSSSASSNGSASGGESTLEKAKKAGSVTVGFANETPYAYQTPDGKLTGEAVEVARAVLKNLGIDEMKGVLTEFGSLIPGLNANRFDIITAGMYITPERCKQVDFANPEYSIGEAIAVKKGNPLNIKNYDDIKNNKDIKVAVMSGAIQSDYLTKYGIDKGQIQFVSDNPSAISALQSGRADVIEMTGPSLQSVLDAAKDGSIERVMDFEQPVIDGKSVRGYGASVFRKADSDFREAFNKELEKMKESGELLEILKKFGFTEQELPGDKTAEALCSPSS